ncbi:MAG TPA: amino acid adenylation domain-containing protein [Thermoanaerobaculia bacterium]|nr:amino acid adenylation domain-containing protein [Thermoanaerobaculia bacterium]
MQAPPIVPVPREGDLPLSFAQQRLWLLDQLEPGSPAYNIPMAVRLAGDLPPGLLERIFGEIVRRHEALRTTFTSREGRPVQVIVAPRIELPVIDLSAVGESEALHLAREEARRPFDLTRGPLLRLTLLRLGARDHVLLMTMHHIVSDGWSMGVLLREVAALYGNLPLPGLAVQYADFAAWQRGWLQGEVLEEQIAYWTRQLAGAPRVLELPTARPRPAVQTFRGTALPVVLPSERVRELCRQAGVTPFMVLLAAWSALLGRHAGQPEVLVGAPIAGRNRREIEGLIGFFVNTLALRADLSDAPGFGELLGRVRRAALDAYTYQDLPFDRLVEELVPERDLSRSPLFQVVFTLQNAPGGGGLEIPGLALERLAVESRTTKFDLTLGLQEHAGGFAGVLEYNTDLFDASTAARLLARFEALLAGAVGDPGLTVPELPLLLDAERQQALREWNDAWSDYPRESSLPGLFAAVARSLPEAPAILSGGEVWSYRRLDEASSRLARRLEALPPESVVGVAMERSAELIVGILAILKAGCAYLPLDVEYPDERLAFMLADTGAPVVLVDERARRRMEGLARLVSLGEEGGERLALEVPAESLALVIYTSGSTGRPKGVALAHRGIVRLVRDTNYLRLGPGDRMGHAANISFDAATLEIWSALLNGAALVMIPRETALSPTALASQLQRDGVTALFLTTALFHQVAREAPEAFAGVHTVMFGGEAADPVAVARVAGPGLVHLYGPAESTTLATWHRVLEVPPGAVTVPIGLPVANSSVYVLDRWQRLVPPGAMGELCVGGDGLARGYLGRPELTAERFIPHPWGVGEGGERLYRTGDLARQRPDGAIEFVGRGDDQVKIRGFRIELGEVEAVLLAHPAVRDGVVLAREDRGGRRLIAWVVGGVDEPALRSWLRERLPDYMVPSAFVFLETLPLTPNGKVDRRALPEPERTRSVEEAPLDLVEELLAGIWAEVLGLDKIGADEDFFTLGGHSLLATQVVSRVRAVLGVELPLRALFESPTVAGIAQSLRAVRESEAGQQAPPITPVPREGDLPLSFSQQRLWFLDQLEPGSPAYNIPLAVRLTGDLSVARLERIFAEVVRRHEALRTTFVSREGRPVQVIAATPGATGLETTELLVLEVSEQEALRLAREEARRPFDLATGPLLRLALIRLDERQHLLLLTLHHIVADGWSMGVLLREIAALYGGQELPELPVQYADFAVWQRRWLDLEGQLAYWKRQLAGAPCVLELPLDRPRPAMQTFSGASLPVSLPAVGELCRREGVTPFMVLLAAWSALLGRHAGRQDVLVGTPIAGRNRREIENLIGFFVNTLVLRADLSGAPGFGELLGRVRRTALDAYTHQDLPFDRLVEELVSERDMSTSPLFQVMLILQNASGQRFELPGMELSTVAVDGGMAKFDLTLALQEGPAGFEGGGLVYNTDLFDGSTAARLAARFQTLLAAAVADPGLPLDELPLLLAAERHQVLAEWNDTAAPRPGILLHELVSAQARRTPEAVAASFEDESLSYGELEWRANRLAHSLIEVGVEGRVGVRMERSLEMIVALLGILKAGAAYVPLDPTYPAERLALLVESSGARVVLDRGLVQQLDVSLPDTALAVPVGDGNLAYVLYTSGSTGTPKGVMIPHRGIVNRLLWMQEAWPLAPGDRVLQKTPFTFDVSLGELFGTLLCGARLVFARPEGHKDPVYLADLIARERITALHFVPSMLGAFLEVAETDLSSVRRVLASGEALPPELVRRLARITDAELLNLYGPTEASVEVSVWTCDPESPVVPIGRPISNLRLHVVDREMRPQLVGVPGELLLGGAGLARGYLDRPDLTAASFVPDPFQAGERLYRTGDLCRLLADGNVEFLGRIDHQVKIRGFRVELGEIEAVLTGHPAVRECVVVVREDTLVAYAVGTAEPDVLRAFLGERLPGYMVPAVFVALDALPLTSSGKVDRAALSAPAAPERTRQAVEPRDVLELRLVRLWEELLGQQPIGVQDDFFELGGHSLLAVQLVARLQKSFGRTLPVAAVLRNPTVERLAAVLREGGEPARGVLVELAPGMGRPFFCVHAVGGEVLSYVSLARQLEVDRPVYGLQAQGDATVEEMAARYVQAIREVQPEGPYSLGGWSMGGVVAFEMACQLERHGETVEPVVLIDSLAPGRPEERAVQDGELVALFANDVARLFGLGLPSLPAAAEDALLLLSAEAERAGLLPAGSGSGEVQRRFKVFQANFRALESYSGAPCAAPVILFKAAETVRPEADLGWSRLSQGPVEVHALPGDHYTLLQQPHVQALAARLRKRLL